MQIGLVCRNQFAGDEVLLLGENPLPYSVVTQGKVTAYKIKSRDLFNLPRDILDNGINRNVLFLCQATDPGTNQGALHRRATRRIQHQCNRIWFATPKGFLDH